MTIPITDEGPLAAVIPGTGAGENLNGGNGDDVINAGGGDDFAKGNAGQDIINGDAGNDLLYGNDGDDILNGGADNDTLLGGAGTDLLNGGAGDDTYLWDGVDLITELLGEGIDTVQTSVNYTLGANIENVRVMGTDNVNIEGNALANNITGNVGDNLIHGYGGNDVLTGSNGRDLLYGGADNDIVSGGNGDDIVNGGGGTDVLNGDNGDDHLNGSTGADVMNGGAGDDRYVVDDSGDVVNEQFNFGTDTVFTDLAGYTLGANVENLIGTGSDIQILNGNALRNTITGGAGADVINGGDNNDILIGGVGNDRLTGGSGADQFIFTNAEVGLSTLAQPRQVDTVWDFDAAAGDRIDFSAIDANVNVSGNQAFTFVSDFTHVAGQARLAYVANTNTTVVQLDVDGDGVSDYQLNLKNGDFTGVSVIAEGDLAHGGWIL